MQDITGYSESTVNSIFYSSNHRSQDGSSLWASWQPGGKCVRSFSGLPRPRGRPANVPGRTTWTSDGLKAEGGELIVVQSADTQVVNFTIDVRSTTVYRPLHLVSGEW